MLVERFGTRISDVISKCPGNASVIFVKKVNVPRNRLESPGRGRGDRGIALHSLDLGTLEGSGWSITRPGHFAPGKHPVPIVQEAVWVPGPVWTCAKNLALTGIRSPDRPARSQSLYRLSYPGSVIFVTVLKFLQLYISF
jgi:hypothetical protein